VSCGVVVGEQVLMLRENTLGWMIGHSSDNPNVALVRAEGGGLILMGLERIAKVQDVARVVTLVSGEERRLRR
jgi:hypothetical protein